MCAASTMSSIDDVLANIAAARPRISLRVGRCGRWLASMLAAGVAPERAILSASSTEREVSGGQLSGAGCDELWGGRDARHFEGDMP